jgi:catechol 2,3-dioxygenase-like lactoylglutathione lyase family enzyme
MELDFAFWPRMSTEYAAMSATSLNHVSVHAQDLAESVAFYCELLGMEKIPTPTFAFPVQWLRLGDQQLHLFVRENVTAPTFHHVGINIEDIESVYLRAQELDIQDKSAFFSNMYELPDGSVQMYIRDPAGNLLELDSPDVTTLSPELRRNLVKLSDTVRQAPEALDATLYLTRSTDIQATSRDRLGHARIRPD